ncbi:unnamed protein product [Porites evermanni]|uniref:Endonuclease/exonuclease/phosphatase domain-containing protein n=1 Tax=Porites evermanni TaxID=104178 RepID=A0ABN8RLC2_9CNID|nr:unnamed protein product [Porites evermanni]
MALAADFLELVSDYKADLFALSESWLTANDTAAKLEIIPSGYKLMNHPPCTKSFVSEFTSYLESIILSTEPILIVGAFNLHVDVAGDAVAGDFLDILESMDLEQHVAGPTHNPVILWI